MTERSEWDLRVARNHAPYSAGHVAMYRAPVELLRGVPATILDVGCGAGYGFEMMLEAECVEQYVGIDSDSKCVSALEERHGSRGRFLCESWPTERVLPRFDYVFCIEVLEHWYGCPGDNRSMQDFVDALSKHAGKALFLSTPDPKRSKHGRWSPGTVVDMLDSAGFSDVCRIDHQWTTFYMATRTTFYMATRPNCPRARRQQPAPASPGVPRRSASASERSSESGPPA